MKARPDRRRGLTLVDVTAAAALAVVLVGAATSEVFRQQQALAHARADARAQAALHATAERLRAGLLPVPSGAAPVTVAAPATITLTLARAEGALDPRLAGRRLVAVTLRAAWREPGGRESSRELLVVLLAKEGP